MGFELATDYNDVSARLRDLAAKHPDATLQQHALEFRTFAGKDWVVYTAACYRTPDDDRPGHGTAWEPVPGKTPYTRDSELQNAETSAWGRAILATLAADARKGVASAEEVRNRTVDRDAPPEDPAVALRRQVVAAAAPPTFATKAEFEEAFLSSTGATYDAADETVLRAFLASLGSAA
jgi:hypothetical protein